MEKKQLQYLSDNELEAMMEDVETHGLIEAPEHMKDNILQMLRQEENVMSEGYKKKSMLIYSIKVSLTAAAAILCIIFMPLQQSEMVVKPKVSMTSQMKEASTQLCQKVQDLSGRLMVSNWIEER